MATAFDLYKKQSTQTTAALSLIEKYLQSQKLALKQMTQDKQQVLGPGWSDTHFVQIQAEFEVEHASMIQRLND